ncbi:MAG TPA: hypothetical protein PK228_14140, partial [Saprospiraceae bacterium]|nr:hypothetical protein [Saprospiraceae bacterium]
MMTNPEYDSLLQTKLTQQLPLMLMPVRLETRYVQQISDVHTAVDSSVSGVLTGLSSSGQYNYADLEPTAAFENALRLSDQLQSLDTTLRSTALPEAELQVYWRLSMIAARFPQYSSSASENLRKGIETLSTRQTELKQHSVSLPAPFQPNSQETGMNASIRKKLEETSSALFKVLNAKEETGMLTATGLLQKQGWLLEQLNVLETIWETQEHRNAGDVELFNGTLQKIKSSLQQWIRSADEAVIKFQSLPEIFQQKLERAKSIVNTIQATYVDTSVYSGQVKVWQLLDRLEAKQVRFEVAIAQNDYAEIIAQVAEHTIVLQEVLTALGALRKNQPEDLFRIRLNRIADRLALSANGVKERWQHNVQQLVNDLAHLSEFPGQIKSVADMAGCKGNNAIDQSILNDLYIFKEQIGRLSSFFAQPTGEKPFVSTIGITKNLITWLEKLLHQLLRLSPVRCEDCEELRHLILSLASETENVIVPLEAEIKNQEGLLTELQNQIKNQQTAIAILKKQTGRSAELVAWNLLDNLSALVGQYPDFSKTQGQNPFEQMLMQADGLITQILTLFTTFEDTDEEMQVFLAQVIGKLELLDQTKGIYQWWNQYLGDCQTQLERLLSELLQLDHIKINECDELAYDQLQPLLQYLRDRLSVLKAGDETGLSLNPESVQGEKLIDLIALLCNRICLVKQTTAGDFKKIEEEINALATNIKSLINLYRHELDMLRILFNRIEPLVKFVADKRRLFEKHFLSTPDFDPHFKLRIKAAAIAAFIQFRSRQYPYFADPGDQLTIMIDHIKAISGHFAAVELFTPEIRDLIFQTVNNSENFVQELTGEMTSGSKDLSAATSSMDKTVEKISALLPFEGKAETDSAGFEHVLTLLRETESLLCQLRRFNTLKPALLAGAEKLSGVLGALAAGITAGQPYTRWQSTILNGRVKELLGQLAIWKTTAVGLLSRQRQRTETGQARIQELSALLRQISRDNASRKISEAGEPAAAKTEATKTTRKGPNKKMVYSDLALVKGDVELWIRVYPDAIAIDNHDPALTQSEVDAGKAYWMEVIAAGQDTGKRLGAWRALAGKSGVQRAAWIVKSLKPTNLAEIEQETGGASNLGSISRRHIVPAFPSPP